MSQRFTRFELKYLVPSARRAAMAAELASRLRLDPYGDATGTYQVTSLYYDSPNLQLYRARDEGARFRRKLRLRVYGKPARSLAQPVMVEIKERFNRTNEKRRIALPLGEALALCAGQRAPPLQDSRDQQVAAEVTSLVRALQLRPACVISFMRQAFVGPGSEPGLRLTFDSDLWSSPPTTNLAEPPARHVFLPPTITVLEVKVDGAVPLWVSQWLARHQAPLRRFSKYGAGLSLLLERERERERSAGHPEDAHG